MDDHSIKIMLLGIAVMLLGGFLYLEMNTSYEIIVVLAGFAITVYGFMGEKTD